jgi:hypothetical protein
MSKRFGALLADCGRWLGVAAVVVIAASASACASAGSGGAQKAAKDFYAAYATLPKGGVPDAAGLAKLDSLITPALASLLAAAAKAEDAHAKATKNEEPPLIEGDLFSSLFEGASAASVGACKGDAQCAISLTYDDGKEKPVTWTDTAVVVSTDKGWRVDDIAYGGTWDFGNKGKLSDTLKAVVAESAASTK